MKGKWMKIVRQYTIITLGISMMAVVNMLMLLLGLIFWAKSLR